jgi:thiosulfate dehydrogenase
MRFLVGFVSGILVITAAVLVFVIGGGMPVATKGEPLPFEGFLARAGLRAALKKSGDVQPPFAPDAGHLLAGAKVYRNHCAGCHGTMDQKDTRFADAMYPHPPLLLPPHKGVTDDSAGETYWKSKNGIRLTGMPGFAQILNDTELWEVSLFLANADHLPAEVQVELLKESRAP